ncbi:MAG: protein phosphatase 2C domain-containing protein [Lachnospiraceae bacterium]|nr:protein phosphatase 2C domain-containing protein [Lachnospiraceae bacterium]
MDLINTFPPLQEGKAIYNSEFSAFAISLQGLSHVKKGTPCQDYSDVRIMKNRGLVIGGIADGLGSCPLSHWGAYIAVTEALDYVENAVRMQGSHLEEEQIHVILNEAFETAARKVEEAADQAMQAVRNLQSTLTVALYDGSSLYCCHVGDDGVVAQTQSGVVKLATRRLKGEEASSVYPLQTGKWEITKLTSVAGFVMATDGVLDAFAMMYPDFNKINYFNRIYYPFMEPAIYGLAGRNRKAAAEDTLEYYKRYLSSRGYQSKITDDLTLVAVIASDTLSRSKHPEFSIDTWNRIEKESERKKAEALGYVRKRERERKERGVMEEGEETGEEDRSEREREIERKRSQEEIEHRMQRTVGQRPAYDSDRKKPGNPPYYAEPHHKNRCRRRTNNGIPMFAVAGGVFLTSLILGGMIGFGIGRHFEKKDGTADQVTVAQLQTGGGQETGQTDDRKIEPVENKETADESAKVDEADEANPKAALDEPKKKEPVFEIEGKDPGPEDEIQAEIREKIGSMTDESKAAQLFLLSPEALTGATTTVKKAKKTTKEAIQKYPVCGLVYHSENQSNQDKFNEMLSNTQSYFMEFLEIPAFLCGEEEEIAGAGEAQNQFEALGLNAVLRKASESGETEDGSRNFQQNQDGSDREVIMTVQNLDELNMLRDENGYQGMIAFRLEGEKDPEKAAEKAVKAITSGADLLFIETNRKEFETVYQAVLLAVTNNTITEERLNQLLERMFRLKWKWKEKQDNAAWKMDGETKIETEVTN